MLALEQQFHNATTHFFTPFSMTMASAGAIRGKYLSNGGVQWLLGSPGHGMVQADMGH
jgi:hypothetical protein